MTTMDDGISRFLIASAALCQAAWADRQQSNPAEKHDLTSASANLRHTIQSLLNTTAVDIGESTALVHACRKVGRDLAVRLDRAENLLHEESSRLRDVWTQDAIEALATRTVALMRQYQTINSGSE
jgi:hypothetical protein